MSFGKTPSGYQQVASQNFSPEMMDFFNQIVGKLSGGGGVTGGIDYLSKLAQGDEDIFKQIEAPAYQALEQNLANTANRFSNYGAQGSSAFQNQLAGQSGQMATNLASQRNDLMTGAIDKLLGYSNQALGQKPYETGLQKKDEFDWGQLASKFPELLKAIASLKTAGVF